MAPCNGPPPSVRALRRAAWERVQVPGGPLAEEWDWKALPGTCCHPRGGQRALLGRSGGPKLKLHLLLWSPRHQTECSGVLRGHGVWPLQRALHSPHLPGKQVSTKWNPEAPHFCFSKCRFDDYVVAWAGFSSTKRGLAVILSQGHWVPGQGKGPATCQEREAGLTVR